MKRCYLVRHGQTAWNSESRIQGYSDLPLSPLGHRQAKRVGVFFAAAHLNAIFTSPLQRSRETAQAIAAGNGHGVVPIVEQELAEMRLGAWEGLTPVEVDARFQGAYQQWRVKPSSVLIPDAEPLEAFRTRVRRVSEKILSGVPEGECVVVSHGGVIAALLADFLQADYDALLRRVRLDNAGITAIEYGVGTPHVLWINSTSHLEALSQSPAEGWF
ncbi:MAG: histidine phosphatase family protein [Candidatus Omnitrophica bacterium]|nr:histidine phosphatase family protein [Candidatus Omnitrophota bacterium]